MGADIYVAGFFGDGGSGENMVKRWNGSSWSLLTSLVIP